MTLIGTQDNKVLGVLDTVLAHLDGMTKKVKEITEASLNDLKRGIPEEDIKALVEGEAKLVEIIDLIKKSLDQLAMVFDSKAACSLSKPAQPVPGQIPISEAQCGNGPINLIALLMK